MSRCRKMITGILALSILLTGCMGCGLGEESPQSTTTVVSEGFIGMCGTDYVSNVRTMHQIPGVLIDQTGYDPVAAKEVIFLKDGQIYDRLVNVIGSEAQIAEKMLEV